MSIMYQYSLCQSKKTPDILVAVILQRRMQAFSEVIGVFCFCFFKMENNVQTTIEPLWQLSDLGSQLERSPTVKVNFSHLPYEKFCLQTHLLFIQANKEKIFTGLMQFSLQMLLPIQNSKFYGGQERGDMIRELSTDKVQYSSSGLQQ